MNLRSRLTAFVFFSLAVCASAHADVPAFLVLSEGTAPLPARVKAVEAAGARVRHRVPPRVLIVDLPAGLKAYSLPGVQNAYTSPVPVETLEPLGPASVAAGLQFNRRLLSAAQAAGALSLGSMRQLMAERSLSAPASVRLSGSPGLVSAAWDPVDGAVYYELQISVDPAFEASTVRSHAVKTAVDVAPPASGTVYARVRGVDPGNPGADDDVYGRWSAAASYSAQAFGETGASAPTPTSPADRLETTGFTLILEWAPAAGRARVQVARDENFLDVVFDEIVSGGEYACPGPALRSGDRLWWRVQGREGGASAWSESRRARIGDPKPEMKDAFVNPEAPK